ncbi:MAG: S8 family serine peptidase [Fimbriimonadaceae bacterium]
MKSNFKPHLMVAGLFLIGISTAQTFGGTNGIGPSGPPVVTAPTHIIVSFKSGTSDNLKSDLSRKYGLKVNYNHSNQYFSRLDLTPSVLNAGLKPADFVRILSTNPAVSYAELDVQITPDFIPNDPLFNQQWHHNNTGQSGGTVDADVDAVEAWDDLANIAQTVVAVCDDGVDLDHEDLQNVIWQNPNEIPGNSIDDDNNGFVDDVNGWDTADNDNDPRPEGGDTHGTHVAGIVAAEHNNGIGVSGVNPNARIMAMRHYAGQGSWMSDLASAIDYAWQNGADVITVSYAIDGFTNALTQAIQRAGTADVVYLNSAGNNSQQNPPRQQLRNLTDNLIFVAATTRNDTKSGFSNWGTLIEVGAPGSAILSTTVGNNYEFFDGTSMATPLAAGIAAMIRGKFPNLTARETLDLLISSSDEVPALTNFIAGGKRVNANNALQGATGGTTIDTFNVVMGTLTSGDLAAILDSDDNKVTIDSTLVNERGVYAAFEVGALSPKAPADVKSIKISVESSTNGIGVAQYVTAYNYTTGAWDTLNTTRLTSTDNEVKLEVAKRNLARYVHPNTLRMRVRCMALAAVKRRGSVPPGFTYSADQVTIKVG